MSDLLQRRTVCFVVRVWAEYQAQTSTCCYGEIECLGNGEKLHFRHWQEIALIIEGQTAEVMSEEPGQ